MSTPFGPQDFSAWMLARAAFRRRTAELLWASKVVEAAEPRAKTAEGLTSLLGAALGPALLGGLTAYTTTPAYDPQASKNIGTGAALGGLLGVGNALYKVLAANPTLAAQVLEAL